MVVLSKERFETFKKCISLAVYGEVGLMEFTCLSKNGDTDRIVQIKKDGTKETALAEVLVMFKNRVVFHGEEKQKITIELRPTKKRPNCKLFGDTRFYKNSDLTD